MSSNGGVRLRANGASLPVGVGSPSSDGKAAMVVEAAAFSAAAPVPSQSSDGGIGMAVKAAVAVVSAPVVSSSTDCGVGRAVEAARSLVACAQGSSSTEANVRTAVDAASLMVQQHRARALAVLESRRVASRARTRKRRMQQTDTQRAAERERNNNRMKAKRLAAKVAAEEAAEEAAASAAGARGRPRGRDTRARRQVFVRDHQAAPSELVSDDAGEEMDAELELAHMSEERATKVYERCRRALAYHGEGGELICIVCQLLTQVARTRMLPLRRLPLANMRCRLAPAADLPAALVAEYDLSSVVPELGGMMLSLLGVVTCKKTQGRLETRPWSGSDVDVSSACSDADASREASDPRFIMCKSCWRSLRRPGKSMPQMALANSNATGTLPDELAVATQTEINLMSLVCVKAGIVVLSGGQRKALKGHSYYYDVGRTAAAEHLPRSVSDIGQDGLVRVVFAGPKTPAAVVAARKRFSARRRVVSDLLSFLKDNNRLYSSVAVDAAALSSLSAEHDGAVPDGIILGEESEAGPYVNVDVARARSDVAGATHGAHGGAAEEPSASLTMSSSGMINMAPAAEGERERRAFEGVFVVRRGGPLRAEHAYGTMAGCFPELFTFGRGGPDETRLVRMSLARWCRRQLMDGRRAFAQHPLFPLLAFDAVGRASMLSKGARHVRMRPQTHGPIAGVTVSELKEHLDRQTQERQACRRGERGMQEKRTMTRASILSNAVFATMSRFPGSNEQREMWRQEAYALCQRFGFPHVFLTVTPDDVNSLTVMYYAGAVGADVFFDDDVACLATRGQRFTVVSKDPVADARCGSLYGSCLAGTRKPARRLRLAVCLVS